MSMNKICSLWTYYVFCLAGILLISCTEDEVAGTPFITISKQELTFGKSQSETLLYIQSNVSYEVVSDSPEWCSITRQESDSKKTGKYLVSVTANPDTESRSTTIKVTGSEMNEVVQVNQLASDLLVAETHEVTVAGEGENFSIKIQASGDYEITVGAGWLHHNSSRALTEKVETFTADPNVGNEARTAVITFMLNDIIESVTVIQQVSSIPEADMTGMEKNAMELMKEIAIGWNLGNSLEAVGGETAWGNPATTKTMITKIKELGFSAVRIPCAWNDYLVSDGSYEIQASWLNRVKEVVDYCVDNELYAILNIHWDGGWLENDIPNGYNKAVDQKQRALWQQIATFFRNYDERLIFAGCNEPNVEDADDMTVLLQYEQTFVDAVRATGGKNVYRNLIVQGPATDIDKTIQWMDRLPEDPTDGRMIVEVHYYSSWQFCGMEKDESWGKAFYFWGEENRGYAVGNYEGRWDNIGGEEYVKAQFQKLKTRFVEQNIPVLIGEFAAIRRQLSDEEAQRGHDLSRAAFDRCVVRQARAHGLVPFYWDRGDGILNRNTLDIYDNLEYNGLIEGLATE